MKSEELDLGPSDFRACGHVHSMTQAMRECHRLFRGSEKGEVTSNWYVRWCRCVFKEGLVAKVAFFFLTIHAWTRGCLHGKNMLRSRTGIEVPDTGWGCTFLGTCM